MANCEIQIAAACFFGCAFARWETQRPIGSLSRSNPQARRIKKGTMNRKKLSGVFSSRIAPRSPPTSDGKASVQTRARFSESWRRYAQELVTEPGQTATVRVALAVIDGMPE